MANNLYNATLRLARMLMPVRGGTVTAASSTTTLVDAGRDEADDYWNGGSLFLPSVVSIISDWALSTHTFTFAARAAAPETNSAYQAAPSIFPIDVLRDAVNQAYMATPWVRVDDTQETTANMEELTLPAGVVDVRQVYVAAATSAPYGFAPHYYWTTRDGKLYFAAGKGPAAAGYKIRLVHLGYPTAELSGDSSALEDDVPLELILAKAKVHALEWRRTFAEPSEELDKRVNEARQKELEAVLRYPVPSVPRFPKLGSF
jgi:hypothetical protein